MLSDRCLLKERKKKKGKSILRRKRPICRSIIGAFECINPPLPAEITCSPRGIFGSRDPSRSCCLTRSHVPGPSSISVSQCVLRSAPIKISVWLHGFLFALFICSVHWKRRRCVLHGLSSRYETRGAHRCIHFPVDPRWRFDLRFLLSGNGDCLERRQSNALF